VLIWPLLGIPDAIVIKHGVFKPACVIEILCLRFPKWACHRLLPTGLDLTLLSSRQLTVIDESMIVAKLLKNVVVKLNRLPVNVVNVKQAVRFR